MLFKNMILKTTDNNNNNNNNDMIIIINYRLYRLNKNK